ncbi:15222_t:CDS:2, partial [Dentiscutata erythropus]
MLYWNFHTSIINSPTNYELGEAFEILQQLFSGGKENEQESREISLIETLPTIFSESQEISELPSYLTLSTISKKHKENADNSTEKTKPPNNKLFINNAIERTEKLRNFSVDNKRGYLEESEIIY